MAISDFFGPYSVYDRFCRGFKSGLELFRPLNGEICTNGQRFNKYPFEFLEKPATIWRKEHFIQPIPERWQPSASTPGYESFPGTKTPSLSSAWSVARSLTPKSSATWRLKKPLNQRKRRTNYR